MSQLDQIAPAVMKILGDSAKLPKEKGDLDKSYATYLEKVKIYKDIRDKLEDAIADVEKSGADFLVEWKQNRDVFTSSDFELDAKKKEDAKKIKTAQSYYASMFDETTKLWNDSMKQIDELDKHCIQMSKYKPARA